MQESNEFQPKYIVEPLYNSEHEAPREAKMPIHKLMRVVGRALLIAANQNRLRSAARIERGIQLKEIRRKQLLQQKEASWT